MTQQKIKGRARIYIDRQYAPKNIEYPKLGTTGFGAMEVEKYFDAFSAGYEYKDGKISIVDLKLLR